MGGRLILIVIVIFLSWGCSSKKEAYTKQPLAEMSQEVEEGKVLFHKYCNSCHPNGTAGLGAPIVTTSIPGFAIRYQIRNGLGEMPAFSEEKISDKEVDKIVDYIQALRDEGK
ncbi:Cytochrome C oxidase, cbb3-type, subunit III [Salinimicrobium catena]|uniref:Cytochrome C oxidase, cbb3-type, subunit III n=1 Tax=Salinimicrobium catena TaxID=390640 RepID=A0A1H5HRK1_9FLAO|nr:cytochrome c [Salinimicrobium catena]SDK72157.1 Cytochrome C oxidase, cbb3-type, subunit III [Salinimicrobium catena]SEE30582.1 Cytochrome C oxidase, cbb3-type, subunit III [Salinimicrobium catena]